jgi:hypothetical protein
MRETHGDVRGEPGGIAGVDCAPSARDRGVEAAIDTLPGGREWMNQIEALPTETRHLAVREGHPVSTNAIDRPFITPELLLRLGLAGSADTQWDRPGQLDQHGLTEVAHQPAGSDISRELTAFVTMAGLQLHPWPGCTTILLGDQALMPPSTMNSAPVQ